MNEEKSKRGRPKRALPYCHDVLRAALHNSRKTNVTAICRDLGISRQTFYYVINGGAQASPDIVRRIGSALGADEQKIFLTNVL